MGALDCRDRPEHVWQVIGMMEAPLGGAGIAYAVCPVCHRYTQFGVEYVGYSLSPEDQEGMEVRRG